jgi:hypothetical protein
LSDESSAWEFHRFPTTATGLTGDATGGAIRKRF